MAQRAGSRATPLSPPGRAAQEEGFFTMLSNRIAPASPTVAAPSAEMQELKELLKEQFGSINSSLARMEQRIDALEGVSGAAKASVTNEVQAVRAMGLVEMDRK